MELCLKYSRLFFPDTVYMHYALQSLVTFLSYYIFCALNSHFFHTPSYSS